MTVTIALAGNPNSGKTTLFNELTGARQHVGNYPGVTVEKKEGIYTGEDFTANIVDLPGTYSLTAYSLEEVVARDFLVNEKPELVVNIVDSSNLERNLYLTMQFLELGIPVCIALNMMDVAKSRGIRINTDRLSELLDVPVIPMIARSGKGKKELMETVAHTVSKGKIQIPPDISYGEDIERALREMEAGIENADFLTEKYNAHWVAIKYLENDHQIQDMGEEKDPTLSAKLKKTANLLADHLEDTLNTYPEAMIADHRYGYIRSILKQGVITRRQSIDRLYVSDIIDRVLINRFAGPFIMLAVVMGLYHFTFTYSEVPVRLFESFFGWMGSVVDAHLPNGLIKSLLIAGVIDGVGGVLGFVPLIMFMFLGIAVLEDSGYLARVAFMMDRVFRFFGLHGSSVMPFIISGGIAGGCAVPGIMATRTLKSRKERLATLLTVPFMNCGAKLPVFALLIAAFFSENEAGVMFAVTLLSWAGALIAAKFLRLSLIKGKSMPFVMELPPYRFPTFKGLLIHTWERTWQYVKKAGTVILGISIMLWAMMTFPGLPDSMHENFENQRKRILAATHSPAGEKSELVEKADNQANGGQDLENRLGALDAQIREAALRHSIAGRMGTALEGITGWAGFDWRINIALIGGFAAKEVIVSTLGTAYSMGETSSEATGSLSKKLAESPDWSRLLALSLIVFTIFYAPCLVAVVSIVRESGSWKWGAFSMAFNTTLAFFLAVIVFQLGSLAGF